MVYGKLRVVLLMAVLLVFVLAFYTFGSTTVFTITGAAVTDLDVKGPANRISENQITIDGDSLIINIKGIMLGRFEDTNSMSPLLDKNANAILIEPTRSSIKVGDIISYSSEEAQGIVTHRVVEVSTDEQGWYVRTKGDNSNNIDPGKIRFSQVKYVLVGILY